MKPNQGVLEHIVGLLPAFDVRLGGEHVVGHSPQTLLRVGDDLVDHQLIPLVPAVQQFAQVGGVSRLIGHRHPLSSPSHFKVRQRTKEKRHECRF